MAKTLQKHGKNIAKTLQKHCKHMAKTWQTHGNNMAKPSGDMQKPSGNMAKTWQTHGKKRAKRVARITMTRTTIKAHPSHGLNPGEAILFGKDIASPERQFIMSALMREKSHINPESEAPPLQGPILGDFIIVPLLRTFPKRNPKHQPQTPLIGMGGCITCRGSM